MFGFVGAAQEAFGAWERKKRRIGVADNTQLNTAFGAWERKKRLYFNTFMAPLQAAAMERALHVRRKYIHNLLYALALVYVGASLCRIRPTMKVAG